MERKQKAAFMLSTGRCGTGTIAHLCQQSHKALAYHVPAPEMLIESFQLHQGLEKMPDLLDRKLEGIHKLIRENDGFGEKMYIETNDKLSFFASELDRHFDAKFFWVIRNPVDFVNSGVYRLWYSGKGGEWDKYRLTPAEGWPANWGVVEKISWLWCEVNSRIEEQMDRIGPRTRTYYFEDLLGNEQILGELMEWLELTDISSKQVHDVVALHINSGKYSAPRDPKTGDHIFGESNFKRTPSAQIDRELVSAIVREYWVSPLTKRHLEG